MHHTTLVRSLRAPRALAVLVALAAATLAHAQSFSLVEIGDPGAYNYASGINNAGTVVGTSSYSNYSQHAFSQSNGVYTAVGVNLSAAWGINNAGTIVGDFPGTGSQSKAFSFANGVFTDLSLIV